MIGPEEHPTWVSQHHFLPQLQTLHLQGIYEHKYVKTSPTQGTGEAFSSPLAFLCWQIHQDVACLKSRHTTGLVLKSLMNKEVSYKTCLKYFQA